MTTMARRRPSRRTTQWTISIAGALLLVGFVGAAQWNSSVARQEFTTSAQKVLADQVLQLEDEQQRLLAQISDAQDRLERYQESATGSQSSLEALNAQIAEARLAAGLTEVRGPGIRVEIADSNRVVPANENPGRYIVLADDLRDLVAALWASGAEAISINGQRLVVTSSIYGVGQSILVNTAFLQPPFVIEAIGPDSVTRFESQPAFLGRVGQRIDTFGLEYASAAMDEITVPAFVGNTALRYGVPGPMEGE